MNKNKIFKVLIIVLLQCMALFYIVIQRESVIKNGETVFIRTKPIDPRDLFRGHYVSLNYDINTLSDTYVKSDEINEMGKPERKVYLSYELNTNQVLSPLKLSLSKPVNKKFIKGYTKHSWNDRNINVRYGIEKFFMQQYKAIDLERGKVFEGVRIPLEMEVKIGNKNGIAVLKGYRYTGIGIGYKLMKKEYPDSTVIKIKIANTEKEPLAILHPKDNSTFKIKPDERNYYEKNKELNIINFTSESDYKDSDIKIIEPLSLYEFEYNLSSANCKILRGKVEIKIKDLKDWGERIEISYVSPLKEKVSHLKNADKLWQGIITTDAFSVENN